MPLNQTDITLQRLSVSLGQLVEQLQITQTTKKDIQIEDVIKALNTTFKTTKGDMGELKSLLKISKSTSNSEQYEKLTKMLELLMKSYDNPDVKQMGRLGITSQNIITEIATLKDEIKSSNIKKNEKANLSILSQAIEQGNRMYATNGFGRETSAFYKKATLSQLKLLKQIDGNIEKGIPLKDLNKTGIWDRLKGLGGKITDTTKDTAQKGLGNGLLTAGADLVLKGMGFGTLPGEFLEMFNWGKKNKDDEDGSKGKSKKDLEREELQGLRVEGLVANKEKAQRSIDMNELVQDRAKETKDKAIATRNNLTVELSKSIADAMRVSGKVDEKYALDSNPAMADTNKIAEAIKANKMSASELEAILKTANEKGDPDTKLSESNISEIMKSFEGVGEYNKVIETQTKIVADTAVAIQESIESVSVIFNDLREILGNELKNEIEQLNAIFSKKGSYRKLDDDTREGLKSSRITSKLSNMATVANIREDELHGIIGGATESKYMEKYRKQGTEYGGKSGMSEDVEKAFNETQFREILDGIMPRGDNKTLGETFQDRVIMEKEKEIKAPPPKPPELNMSKELPQLPNMPEPKLSENINNVTVDSQMDLSQMADIMKETITDFLKEFEQNMKDREKEAKSEANSLRKALTSGDVKVVVTNLKDIPAPQITSSVGGGGGPAYNGPTYGD